jgi:hypothetical protein
MPSFFAALCKIEQQALKKLRVALRFRKPELCAIAQRVVVNVDARRLVVTRPLTRL